jgi:hypothetical protein
MKYVEVIVESIMVEDVHYTRGDVLFVADTKAEDLIHGGAARPAAEGKYVNEVSLIADAISPEPSVSHPINPADALAPSVVQNPGLADLVTATGKAGEVPDSGTAAGMKPIITGPDGDASEAEAVKTDGTIEGTDPKNPVSVGPNAPAEVQASAKKTTGSRNVAKPGVEGK